ncbi:MAG: helix-turn-helix domain-containing protein [Xenococcaceae cyanobacterium]
MEIAQFKFQSSENVLKQVRLALDMTQKEFAIAIGIGERSMTRYENGLREPMFTLAQIKALQLQLLKLGLDFQDLPDNWNVEIKSESSKKRRKTEQKKAS